MFSSDAWKRTQTTRINLAKIDLQKARNDLKKINNRLKMVNTNLTGMELITIGECEVKSKELSLEKKALQLKIDNFKINELPVMIRKMKQELEEAKKEEFPIEVQRQTLENDILSNLRPMKEVKVDIQTQRLNIYLDEKLKAGEISQKDHDLYKSVGYDNYTKYLDGELKKEDLVKIAQLPEVKESIPYKAESKPIETNKPIPPKVEPKPTETKKPSPIAKPKSTRVTHSERMMQSLYKDPSSLFYVMEPGVTYNSHLLPYKTAKYPTNIEISPEQQLMDAKVRRDDILIGSGAYDGSDKGLNPAFKQFIEHGVLDIKGKKIELNKRGEITDRGWKQLQAAMNIYRDKRFETFRYILINKDNGTITDQLTVSSRMPNISITDNESIKAQDNVIARAKATNSLIVIAHNHPSGNPAWSDADELLTLQIESDINRRGGKDLFGGHIILDHDKCSIYDPDEGWRPVGDLYNEAEAQRNGIINLVNVSQKINEKHNWNDNYIPIVFTNLANEIVGIKLYDKETFNHSADMVRNKLQFNGIPGAAWAFPVITQGLMDKMSRIEGKTFIKNMTRLVEKDAVVDVFLPDSNIRNTLDVQPPLRPMYDTSDIHKIAPRVETTWATCINAAIYAREQEQKAMKEQSKSNIDTRLFKKMHSNIER